MPNQRSGNYLTNLAGSHGGHLNEEFHNANLRADIADHIRIHWQITSQPTIFLVNTQANAFSILTASPVLLFTGSKMALLVRRNRSL
jgi:hypothetical protein